MNHQTSGAPGGILGRLIFSCAPRNAELLVQRFDYDGVSRGGVIIVPATHQTALCINGAREALIPPGRFVCDESANIPALTREERFVRQIAFDIER